MMAELYGKVTGTNRGKGGSMHITDITTGVLGVNPIVGAGATHAIGAGLSAKVRKTDRGRARRSSAKGRRASARFTRR